MKIHCNVPKSFMIEVPLARKPVMPPSIDYESNEDLST